ncbi:MAG: RNA-binding cell elongation regulator Jag/EloR [Clostridia bacterium]|nr:RNA-binding cell elongation regulator Jag/EloR [Clostridia bacterium]
MLKFPKKTEKTAKSIDEAKELLLAELGLSENEVEFTVVEEGTKGFLGLGAKEAVVAAEVKDVVSSVAKKFLTNLFETMNLNVEVKTDLNENMLNIELVGDNLGIVIGKRGDTLDSIQYLTSLVVNSMTDDYIKVTIDAENYRQKRHDSLIALSERLAQKVAKTGRKHTLEPMNPYERRIIHANLQSNDKVTTFSVGEEPYRKVVISPKNPRPYSRNRYSEKKSSFGGYSNGYEATEYTPSYSDSVEDSEE